jgi:gamma-glutamylcyclotransferase (GGCT)/AIG2-like uncharacterized protein YtfP
MSDAADVRLFSYGTLRQAQVQMASFGRLLEGREDVLPGYRLAQLEITDPEVLAKSEARHHPIAELSAGDEVAGTVFEITEAELAAADAYEVSDYARVAVRLKSGLDAFVYVRAG